MLNMKHFISIDIRIAVFSSVYYIYMIYKILLEDSHMNDQLNNCSKVNIGDVQPFE